MDRDFLERNIDNTFISRHARKMEDFVRKIPPEVIAALQRPYNVTPKPGTIYALIRQTEDDEDPIYARCL